MEEDIFVRRVIPWGCDCLFKAVGYVMKHHVKKEASELRGVIAAIVATDPMKYSYAFLGMLNEAYCNWILSESWGGAIELSILADHYGCEIAAYDIQTTQCNLYGQEKNYSERVMLIYNGLHYDALALSPIAGAPKEFDQTIFVVNEDGTIGPVEKLALNFVKEEQRQDSILSRKRNESSSNTANFTLRCMVCKMGLIDDKEAVEHAYATDHENFEDYIVGTLKDIYLHV